MPCFFRLGASIAHRQMDNSKQIPIDILQSIIPYCCKWNITILAVQLVVEFEFVFLMAFRHLRRRTWNSLLGSMAIITYIYSYHDHSTCFFFREILWVVYLLWGIPCATIARFWYIHFQIEKVFDDSMSHQVHRYRY